MRRFSANATHLVTTLAVTAAAVLTAFSMPLPAHALTISVYGDGNAVSGSGKEVAIARQVGAFSVLRLDSSIDVHAHQGTTPSVTRPDEAPLYVKNDWASAESMYFDFGIVFIPWRT